jgi:hypothetical protein
LEFLGNIWNYLEPAGSFRRQKRLDSLVDLLAERGNFPFDCVAKPGPGLLSFRVNPKCGMR